MHHLARVDAPKSNSSLGAAKAAALCAQGITFEVLQDGETIAAYNLQLDDHGVAWVMAAGGGRPGLDLTATVTPAIEAQARALGAHQLALNTKRRGLIKKMQKQGFALTSATLRKTLK